MFTCRLILLYIYIYLLFTIIGKNLVTSSSEHRKWNCLYCVGECGFGDYNALNDIIYQ